MIAALDVLWFLRQFFRWYNEEHRHGGIGYMTPAQVHYDKVAEVMDKRERALAAAFRDHPERFKGRRPVPPAPPTAVSINPPAIDCDGQPSSRSRRNVVIEPDRPRNDALTAPESGATQGGKGMAIAPTEDLAAIKAGRSHRLVLVAH